MVDEQSQETNSKGVANMHVTVKGALPELRPDPWEAGAAQSARSPEWNAAPTQAWNHGDSVHSDI